MRLFAPAAFVTTLLALCTSAAPVAGQPPADRPAASQRLDFLVGEWKWAGYYTNDKGRQNFEDTAKCEWQFRSVVCRTNPADDRGDIQIYTYNERKKRHEGVFVDAAGEIVTHPIRWDGGRMIAEYEYYVFGAFRQARRIIEPQGNGWRYTIEDLADDKVTQVVVFTATKQPK